MPGSIRSMLVLFFVALTAPAADPSLLGLVMPDARVIMGFDIARVTASPFGRFLFSQMPASPGPSKALIDQTGFDPRRDLGEVLVAATGPSENAPRLILARGSFDASRLTAAAKMLGATSRRYKGIELYTAPEPTKKTPTSRNGIGKPPWFAILDARTAIAGDIIAVRGAIDRHALGRGPNPKLVASVNALSARYDIWALSMMPVSELASRVPDPNLKGAMGGDVLRAVQQSSGGIRFGQEIEISGEAVTRSSKDAVALADVIRFLTGLILNSHSNAPQAGPSKLLQSLDLRTEGNVMRMSLRVPQSDVEKFILSAKERATRTSAPAASKAKSAPRAPRTAPKAGGLTVESSEMGKVEIK